MGSPVPPSILTDLAPSDFHLFRSLQHFLDGKNSEALMKSKPTSLLSLSLSPVKFYSEGIQKLVERWDLVGEQEDNYILD